VRLPKSISFGPSNKSLVDGLPRCKIRRQQPQGTTGAQYIEESTDQRSSLVACRNGALAGRALEEISNQSLYGIPFGIRYDGAVGQTSDEV
jgi:hypothetical protein